MGIFIMGVGFLLVGLFFSRKKEVMESIETKKDYLTVMWAGIILMVFGLIYIIRTGGGKIFGIVLFLIFISAFASFGIIAIVKAMKTK